MTVNVEIDETLLRQAMDVSGVMDRTELIEQALRKLISSSQKPRILELKGKVEFWHDYDYKALRD